MTISYMTFRTDSFGLRFLDTFTTIDSTDTSLIPPGAVAASDITLPYPLGTIYGDWETAFGSPAIQYYAAAAGTTTFQLIPIISYYYPVTVHEEEPVSSLVVNKAGGEVRWYNNSEDLVEFFELSYPGQEVDPPLTWDEIKERGVSIIQKELAVYVTSSIITGNQVPAAVVAVQAVCALPENEYTSPQEALPYFQAGAKAIAEAAGFSWPPPLS